MVSEEGCIQLMGVVQLITTCVGELVLLQSYEKRNPFAIFVELGLFFARLATSFLARAANILARVSPRLARLAKNKDTIFRIAEAPSDQQWLFPRVGRGAGGSEFEQARRRARDDDLHAR